MNPLLRVLCLLSLMMLPAVCRAATGLVALPADLLEEGRAEIQLQGLYGRGLDYYDNRSGRFSLSAVSIESSHLTETTALVRIGIGRELNLIAALPVIQKETRYVGGPVRQGGGLGDISLLLARQFGRGAEAWPSLSLSMGVKIPSGKSRWGRFTSEEDVTSPNGALEALSSLTAEKQFGPAGVQISGGISLPVPFKVRTFNGVDLTPEQQAYPYQPGNLIWVSAGVSLIVVDGLDLLTDATDVLTSNDVHQGIFPGGFLETGRPSRVGITHAVRYAPAEPFAFMLGIGYDVHARSGLSYLRAFGSCLIRTF